MRLFAILVTTAALVALSSTAPTLITKHILKSILFSPFRNRVLIVKPVSLPQLPFVVPASFPILSSLFNRKHEEPAEVVEEAPHIGGVTTVLHPLPEHYHHYDLPSYTEVHQHVPEVHHHTLPEVTIENEYLHPTEATDKIEYVPDAVKPVTAVSQGGSSSSVHTVYPAPVPAPPAPVQPPTGNEVDGFLLPAPEGQVPFQQYGLPIVVNELSDGSSSSSSSSHTETNVDAPESDAKYVAVNLGVRHEAPLPGYDHSVVIENLEPAPEHPDHGDAADVRSSF